MKSLIHRALIESSWFFAFVGLLAAVLSVTIWVLESHSIGGSRMPIVRTFQGTVTKVGSCAGRSHNSCAFPVLGEDGRTYWFRNQRPVVLGHPVTVTEFLNSKQGSVT